MSRFNSNTKAASFPATLHVRAIRIGLGLAIAASLLAFAVRAGAQQTTSAGSIPTAAASVSTFGE
jgi:hypothetical protein